MPVQRNNLSWLYTTVGFCSVKFSLYLLLCPDSRRSQPGYPAYGAIVRLFSQVFDGTPKRSNLAGSCANRTGSHVRLCAHRKTRRSHRSGIRTSNRPSPHKPVPKRTFHSLPTFRSITIPFRQHSIPSTFRSITILSITDGTGYRQKTSRNAKRRSCAGCTLSATSNPANCPVINQEHHQPHVCEDIHHVLKADIPSPIRAENTESCMSRHAQPDRSRRTRPVLRKFHRIAHAMTHTTWQKLPTQQPQTVMPDIPICPDHEYHRN
ncbi:hypothetical protein DSM100238_0884 [Bifidobacterium apri]|uniref:Uncharacterized protein n=1 Tax=Bifidobacterium apri TaxID=1769423 RepID=A0A6A2VHV3_9BIFI|nr:hypothetical protein DSM100238_0884 [Bifidobacterium apri]